MVQKFTSDKAMTINTADTSKMLTLNAQQPMVFTQLPMASNILQALPGFVQATPAVTPAVPVEPVSTPTFEKASDSFGTIRHVDPIRDQLVNAFLTMEKLRLFAAEAPGVDEPLLVRVEKYLQEHMGAEEYKALLDKLGVSVPTEEDTSYKPATFVDPKLKNLVSDKTRRITGRFFKQVMPKIGESTNITIGDVVDKPGEVKNINVTHNTHSALFQSGRVMAGDIRVMEALRHALVKVRREHQLLLEKNQAELAALETRMQTERATLAGLEAKRSEVLDDYVVAQRLLAEHWQDIKAKTEARANVINGNVGLYYVKVRETPVTRTLPDPLDLRSGSASDLVPGCANTATTLADELHPFMDTVLDIPASDWAALSALASHLPGRYQLEHMVNLRRARIASKTKVAATNATQHPTLISLLFNHQSIMQSVAARPFAVAALRDMQLQGHRILALEDMLALSIPPLRDPATQLHQRLVTAAGCLLQRLREVRPSIRLAWADLADDNRLPVESPERWPNLDKAEADDFNNLRTLVELVQWWFRQLDSDASGESRTAMRNFIRACLLLAASDDPQQLLQGQIKTLPARLRAGELLRLDLNREPSPGNLLQLLDDRQQVVATVRVEDHDDKGTVATIATVINPDINLTLAMRVTGKRS